MQLDTNLDASAAVGDNFSTPISVYDSLGVSHTLTFQFTKTGANAWSYNATIPAADVGATGAPVSVSTGTLTFDGNGVLTAPTANVSGIGVTGLVDGAANMTLNWNLFDANNNPLVTQVASASTTTNTSQDGYSSGTLLNFNRVTPYDVCHLQGVQTAAEELRFALCREYLWTRLSGPQQLDLLFKLEVRQTPPA
jgi:flagellar hook protein FlgE